ncbi:MAG: hypothetical protein ABSD47_14780 [Candidatus Methylomirabilota bacterium]|jgi:hypothetical protein
MKKRTACFIVVDIETDVPDPKQAVDLCEPFLVGMKPFSVVKGELQPGKYRYFEQKDFAKGARGLRRFPGPIVGYNLLGFDYVVLRELVNVEPFLERTVDLLDFLSRKMGSHRGLKLHKVCMELLGQGKSIKDARGLAAMWEAGEREGVLQYNECDCDLTARLWLWLRNRSRIKFQKRTLQLTKDDQAFLDGRCPVFTYTEWLQKNFEPQTQEERVDPFQGVHVNPLDLAREYDRYLCKKSGAVIFTRPIPASDIPSGEDIGPRHCPACGEYVWHSGDIFKEPPKVEWDPPVKPIPENIGKPIEMAQVEKLWAMIRPYVEKWEEGHFLCEGIPRRERQEVPCYDYLGIDEEDFTLWLRQVEREPELVKYIPRFRKKISYITTRGAKALALQAMLEGF